MADFSAKRELFQERLWEYTRKAHQYPTEANVVIASMVMRIADALSDAGNKKASNQMKGIAEHLRQANPGPN